MIFGKEETEEEKYYVKLQNRFKSIGAEIMLEKDRNNYMYTFIAKEDIELNKLSENHDYKTCCLFVTNFLTNNSHILFSDESKKVLEIAYGIDELEQGQMLKGVVSRKKQMVPNIMPIVEHL